MKYPFVKDTQLKSPVIVFYKTNRRCKSFKKDVQQINIVSIITSRPNTCVSNFIMYHINLYISDSNKR